MTYLRQYTARMHAAMFVFRNNRKCLHKNVVEFPKDKNFIVLNANVAAVYTPYLVLYNTPLQKL